MILVTGAFGFIGRHVTRALTDLGEQCLLIRHRAVAGSETQNVVADLDIADERSLIEIVRRHDIGSIVHLAGAALGGDVVDDLRANSIYLCNVLKAATTASVGRLVLASTIGVYAGAPGPSPYREDALLPAHGIAPIPAAKKAAEAYATVVAGRSGLELAIARIGAAWGPYGRPGSRFFPLPRMVHAAVAGDAADFTGPPASAYEHDGIDVIRAADVGRAIALLATVPALRHDTYNVASGTATTAAEMADAVRQAVPDARIDLAPGRNPAGQPSVYLDIERLRTDTGFAPATDITAGVVEYIDWLRAGNAR